MVTVKLIDPPSVMVTLVVVPLEVVVVVPEVNSHKYVSPAPPPEAVKVSSGPQGDRRTEVTGSCCIDL